MKNLMLLVTLISCSLTSCATNQKLSPPISPVEKTQIKPTQQTTNGNYTLVIEGYDWGPAASKVILAVSDSVSVVNGTDYDVLVNKATHCAELQAAEAEGKLRVLYAYVSDGKGNRLAKGNHIALALYVAPFEQINSPIKYFGQNPKCNGNQWIDFKLTISNLETKQIWDKESDRIMPQVDEFDLTGRFSHNDVTLTYASFTPQSTATKRPLIIWLHGGGEGGVDPTIPLLANKASNYASEEIQTYFGGAYVLVPQSPSFWMDNGAGAYTRGEVNDMYNESLMALIKDYVNQHPTIDQDRIYVGGCSNGGYMTLKLLLLHPDYFAAAFPSALAFHAKNLSSEDIDRIKDIPIWFIHSKDDPVTVASETVIPAYQQLIEAGADNVHLSLFDHVIDITNQHGGAGFNYLGHFSWIYSHANKCQFDYDGQAVTVDGQPVTLMGWMARQRRVMK